MLFHTGHRAQNALLRKHSDFDSERPAEIRRGHPRLLALTEVLVVAKLQAGARRHVPVQRGTGHAAITRQADAADRRVLVDPAEAGIEHFATQAERLLPRQVRLQAQAAAVGQRPATRGTQPRATLPTGDGLCVRFQAEAVRAHLIEAATPDLRILQVDVRRDLRATERQAITAFAIRHAVTAVAVAGDAGVPIAELELPTHVFPVAADPEATHRVPRTADHTAVQHPFHGVAATLIGALGKAAQTLAATERVTGEPGAADALVGTDHHAAEVVTHTAVPAARHGTVVAEVLYPTTGLRRVEQAVKAC